MEGSSADWADQVEITMDLLRGMNEKEVLAYCQGVLDAIVDSHRPNLDRHSKLGRVPLELWDECRPICPSCQRRYETFLGDTGCCPACALKMVPRKHKPGPKSPVSSRMLRRAQKLAETTTMSQAQIAESLGVTAFQLNWQLRKIGARLTTKAVNRSKQKISDEQVAWARDRWQEGSKVSHLAKELGIGTTTLWRRIQRLAAPVQPYTAQAPPKRRVGQMPEE